MKLHDWEPLRKIFGEGTAMDLANWVQCRRCGAVLFQPDETTPFRTMEDAMASQSVKADCDLSLVLDVMRA